MTEYVPIDIISDKDLEKAYDPGKVTLCKHNIDRMKRDGVSIEQICIYIYDLFQDKRIISETEEDELYRYVDPNDECNCCPADLWFNYDNSIDDNPLLEKYVE